MNEELMKYIFFTNCKEKNKIQYYKLQAAIIDKLEKHNFALCFDEVGLGKTIQGIYGIWNCIQKKKPNERVNILIIAPNEILAKKWKEEILNFLGISFTIVHNRAGKENNDIKFNVNKDNLYITYNSSNYSNLGITKLTNYGYEPSGRVFEDCYFNVSLGEKAEVTQYMINRDNIDDWVEENYEWFKENDIFETKEELRKYGIHLSYYNYEFDKTYKYRKEKKYIYKSKWDFLIIDEVHLINRNYIKAMTKECVEVRNEYYTGFLGWHEAKQLLLLTATPIKNSDENNDYYKWLLEIVKKLAPEINSDIKIQTDKMLDFDINLPYQRYFKEVVLESSDIKTRNVNFLKYPITEELGYIWESRGYISPSNECGNVFLMIEKFIDLEKCNDDIITAAYASYKKPEYTIEDLEKIKRLDKKVERLIEYIRNELSTRIIIFCTREATRSYLGKILKCLGIKVTELTAGDSERNEKIDQFNEEEDEKALISTWQIGNVGINLHGADTVICYEPNTNLDKLEQGFGRIDRLGLGFDNINMIYLKPDERSSRYDNYKINTIFDRLFTEQLPNIPSKNLLFTTDYLSEHIRLTQEKYTIYHNLRAKVKEMNEDEVYSINQISDWCNVDDFNLVKDELFIEKSTCDGADIVNKSNSYLRNVENITLFLSKATTNKNKDRKPEEILKEAVYYYDERKLKLVSIQQLIEKAKEFMIPSEEEFNEGITFLSNNAKEIIFDEGLKDKLYDRYHPLLLKGIMAKNINLPIKFLFKEDWHNV